jgi:hypothetical protein
MLFKDISGNNRVVELRQQKQLILGTYEGLELRVGDVIGCLSFLSLSHFSKIVPIKSYFPSQISATLLLSRTL